MARQLDNVSACVWQTVGMSYSDAASVAKITRQAIVERLDFAFECEIYVTVPDGTVCLTSSGITPGEAIRRGIAQCVANFAGRKWIGVDANVMVRFSNGAVVKWPLESRRLQKMVHAMNWLFPDVAFISLSHAESLRLWRAVKTDRADDDGVADEFVTNALRAVLAAAKRDKVEINEWIRQAIAAG